MRGLDDYLTNEPTAGDVCRHGVPLDLDCEECALGFDPDVEAKWDGENPKEDE